MDLKVGQIRNWKHIPNNPFEVLEVNSKNNWRYVVYRHLSHKKEDINTLRDIDFMINTSYIMYGYNTPLWKVINT